MGIDRVSDGEQVRKPFMMEFSPWLRFLYMYRHDIGGALSWRFEPGRGALLQLKLSQGLRIHVRGCL